MNSIVRCLVLLTVFQTFAFSQNGQKIHISGTRLWIDGLPNYEPVGTFPVLREKKGKAEIVFTETSKPFTEVWDLSHKAYRSTVSETRRDSIIDTASSTRSAVVISHRLEGLIDPQGITTVTYMCGDSAGAFCVTVAYPDIFSGEVRNVLAVIVAGIEWRRNIDTDPLEQHDCTLRALNEYVPVVRTTTEIVYTPYGLEIDSTESIPYFIVRSLFTRWTDLRPQEKKQYFEDVLKSISSDIHIGNVVEHGPLNLDGVDGYQAVASGSNESNGTTVHVCLTVLFHPSGYLGLIGFAPENDHEKTIERFKEIAGSFERMRFTGNADSASMRLLESKQYAKAEKCYNAALQKDPTSVPLILGKAAALMGLHKYGDAIALYSGLIENQENLDSAHVGRAQAYMKLERYRDAIDDYNRAIELNTGKEQYYVDRARAKAQYGNGQGAALDYEKAISISPRTLTYYIAYAEAMLGSDEAIKAQAMLERAFGVDSTDRRICRLLGEVLNTQKKYPEALLYYNRAEEHGERSADFYVQRSRVKCCMENIAGALSDAAAACRIDTQAKDALCCRGKYNLFLGKLNDAVNDLTAGLHVKSSRGEEVYLRGLANLLLGKHAEAAADFRKFTWNYRARILLYIAEWKKDDEPFARKNLILYKHKIEAKHYDLIGEQVVRYALREISADELIGLVTRIIEEKKGWHDLGEAYFAVGVMEYFSGLKNGSKKSFDLCMKSLQPDEDTYHLARMLRNKTEL